MECNNVLTEGINIVILTGVAYDEYAMMIYGEQKLIKSRKEEVTCGSLVEAMRKVW